MGAIEVIEPGLLTTVQDLGRYGYLRDGVPPSGAMDAFALRVANILSGNPEHEACLEITVTGPRLRFSSDATIALTGADLTPLLGGEPVPMWESVSVRQGGILSFGGPRSGSRSYLAVTGGLDVPNVMGSRSTYLKANMGGFKGRSLVAGDVLPAPLLTPAPPVAGRRLPRGLRPSYGQYHLLRVILGPQDDAFTDKGIETFLGSNYALTTRSDRMGFRLEGPAIEHRVGPDIISDGIAFGGVQVAGDGQPIVLMADRGTSGGYTKIATVISADLGNLAQGMPGDEVRFQAVSIEEAHEALRRQEETIQQLREMLAVPPLARRFRMVLEGSAYDVSVELSRARDSGNERGQNPWVSGKIQLLSEVGESHSYPIDVEDLRRS